MDLNGHRTRWHGVAGLFRGVIFNIFGCTRYTFQSVSRYLKCVCGPPFGKCVCHHTRLIEPDRTLGQRLRITTNSFTVFNRNSSFWTVIFERTKWTLVRMLLRLALQLHVQKKKKFITTTRAKRQQPGSASAATVRARRRDTTFRVRPCAYVRNLRMFVRVCVLALQVCIRARERPMTFRSRRRRSRAR